MELLFTDGETFFHEEKRDLMYDFQYIDSDAPAVRVTAQDPDGRYAVTKEFISDPHSSGRADEREDQRRRGGSVAAEVLCTAGSAFEWRRRGEFGAVDRCGGKAVPAGVEGRDTCWRWERTAVSAVRPAAMWGRATAIRTCARDMKMTWQFGQALDGNIAVMGEIDVAAEPGVHDCDLVWRWAAMRRWRR